MTPSLSTAPQSRGFALVTTLSLMVLLVLICVSLLQLSAISLRLDTQYRAQAEARANARLAMMIALGELQKEMGPDMRVSAEAAIFDTDPDTETIEGVEQSRWAASYHAWGDWLNATYQLPGSGPTLTISDTYTARRNPMFRRWLLSLPEGMESDIDAPNSLSDWNDGNSVILVGEGSLGKTAANDQITRARLVPVDDGGNYAWWIALENHRAKINLGRQQNKLPPDIWETAQGNTAEVAVSVVDGFQALEQDDDARSRLITTKTMEAAGIERDIAQGGFFDLTAHSEGIVASVRGGHLKKDLSLLFENDNADLPMPYRFDAGAIREPSVRPMSPELQANNPRLPDRHFASWSGMRHFYRMYRADSEARSPSWTGGGTGGAPGLKWARGLPYSEVVTTSNCFTSSTTDWDGRDTYMRVPVLAKLTFIHSLLTERAGGSDRDPQYRLYLVYTPVYTYWNPYNVELRVPDNTLAVLSSAYKAWPLMGRLHINDSNTPDNEFFIYVNNTWSQLRSGTGGEIVFKPGEFRVFSNTTINGGVFGDEMLPGFDPQAFGGQRVQIRGANNKQLFRSAEKPELEILFSHSVHSGNVNHGNTPGSLDVVQDWAPEGAGSRKRMALNYQIDWFDVSQTYAPITIPGDPAPWIFDNQPSPSAFTQLMVKGASVYDYDSINWERDWRSRNWIQSPPFYFGGGLYISENSAIAHTQRLDCPYVVNFGPLSPAELPQVIFHVGGSAFLGSGPSPVEKVNQVPVMELPTAPVGSLAGFAGMRIKPGWTDLPTLNSEWTEQSGSWNNTADRSLVGAEVKALAYQSGVTGPGIGNSFLHPAIPRTGIYQFIDNSVSMDPINRTNLSLGYDPTDTRAYCDYWDHVFLLNDALWDDYFVSSLADQTRPGAAAAVSLRENLDHLVSGQEISNSRFTYHSGGLPDAQVREELADVEEGYLKAARHVVVDGMFNVNSTSVDAWQALFSGIRGRQLVYRGSDGRLRQIEVPSGKRIALSRFNTEVSDQEMDDPETGVNMPDGSPGWSGVRYLDDRQLRKLAEECVKQVKLRGPFLNFSEFVNRRLSADALGLMGALQSAIDYDDASPDPDSLNYNFKNGPDFMMDPSAMGRTSFATPEAAGGSRFAGIPGYIIQSDLLKPIANTLSVRDDTFRIRAYGESLDAKGRVRARAWCEAIVQRVPEYGDATNNASVPARVMSTDGVFTDNPELTETNRRFGRKFEIRSFRWLNSKEV